MENLNSISDMHNLFTDETGILKAKNTAVKKEKFTRKETI